MAQNLIDREAERIWQGLALQAGERIAKEYERDYFAIEAYRARSDGENKPF